MGDTISLPYMSADPNSVTVSGHSAGCYMAQEMAIVKSATIHGAGLFQCWSFEMLDNQDLWLDSATNEQRADDSLQRISDSSSQGKIDAPSNLIDNSIYIFSGELDHETPPDWQVSQNMVYEQLGVEHLHYQSAEVDHYYGPGYMLPALKQIYVDLGYADDLDDFNEPATGSGQWVQFY